MIGDIFRAEVHQNVGSEPTMNVLHIRQTVAETIIPEKVADIVSEMVAATFTALAAQLAEDWRVVQITTRQISGGGGNPSTTVYGGAEAIEGAIVGDQIPSSSAALISFYTSNFTRSGRGRIYLAGLPEAAQKEGQFVEATWATIQALVTAQFVGEKGPFLTGDSKYRYVVFGGGGGSSADQHIVKAELRPNLATQRRRRAFPGFA